MQSVSFYALTAFLMVLTLIASTVCDSAVPVTTTLAPAKDISPPKVATEEETPAKKDDSKVEQPIVPTKLPASDAVTLSTKPGLLHDPTVKPTDTKSNDADPTKNATKTMEHNAAKTEKKNGASKVGPEFLVTSLIVLILSAVYA